MVGKIFFLVQLCLESRHLAASTPKTMRVNGTICNHITSNSAHDRWLCGTFVSSALQFFALLTNGSAFSRAFACQWGCVACSDRNWEYVRSCAGSKQPSLSLCQGRQTTDCHIWLAGCCCCFCKSSNPLQHLCYLCHHIISFLCASLLRSSPLFVSFFLLLRAAAWTLSQKSKNISACKSHGEREGESKTGCQSPVFVSVYIFRNVNIYWNCLCLAKQNKARGCLR